MAPSSTSPGQTQTYPVANGDNKNEIQRYRQDKTIQQQHNQQTTKKSIWSRARDVLSWTPPPARYDPNQPPKFSMSLNILFGFAGAFTVANLYYNHPILNILAQDFGVPYVKVADIPTLAQAGYAIGLLTLCPLGDKLPRRPFVLTLMLITATLTIPMAVTPNLQVFLAFQFITGLCTVTPQLMLPLVGDLAPPKRRAAALSIVVSGLMLGILIARLLSGIVTQFISWRYVYWISIALQYLIILLLWIYMPSYPPTNPSLHYFRMLWSILVMLTKHPVLVQACLISFFTSATFTGFWTVLTFLLSSPPYSFGPVIIGLFALVGIASMLLTPFYARLIIDRYVPAFSVLLGIGWAMVGICVGTYTGEKSIAGPIVQAFLADFGVQTCQIANRSAIFTIEPNRRNGTNTAFMVATFLGQLVGTTVSANLYSRGGWVASGSYSVASMGCALLVTLARGPWEERWVGWRGGWSIKKKSRESVDGKIQESPPEKEQDGESGEGIVEKSLDVAAGEEDVESKKGSEGEDNITAVHSKSNGITTGQ